MSNSKLPDGAPFKIVVRVDVVPNSEPLPPERIDGKRPRMRFILDGQRKGAIVELSAKQIGMQPMPHAAAMMIHQSLAMMQNGIIEAVQAQQQKEEKPH